MNQLFYSVRFLLRGKSNNIIKIISLTLGLVVALLLFSKVAFEYSYDSFYPDADRLYRLERKVMLKGDPAYDGPMVPGAIPGGLRDEVAGIENSALVSPPAGESEILYEETRYKENVLLADTGFFDFFGFRLIEGNKELLGVSSNIFLSRSFAKRIFGNQPAVGKKITLGKTLPVTVAGVYEDIPKNSHLHTEAVLSLETGHREWGFEPLDWVMFDSYMGYLKLYGGVDAGETEELIAAVMQKHIQDSQFGAMGLEMSYTLQPVSTAHSGDPTVKKTILILSLLGFSLLIVAAMNYVLISISSLVKRAKAIGVHKCSGASSGHVFRQFLYETALLIIVSFILSAILIFMFRQPVEAYLEIPVSGIFSTHNLSVILLVVAAILFAAGIIPGWIFSSIPVTQVFRTYTATNRQWKRLLLFVQFGGIAFIVSLLWIIVNQYDMILNKDMGYRVENVVYTAGAEFAPGEQLILLKREFERMPQVLSVSMAERIPMEGMSGWPIMDESRENMLFSSRQMTADRDYFETMGIEFVMGSAFPEHSESLQIVVNEAFCRAMQWTDSPIGQSFNFGGPTMVICGVVKDFQLMTFHTQRAAMLQDIPPLGIFPLNPPYYMHSGSSKVILHLQDMDPAVLASFNKKLKELLNNEDAHFVTYKTRIRDSYSEARLFRNSILVAAVVMLIIAILGIIGYVQDEINRRSKEIGIRKINGATVRDILVTISKEIVFISLPSIVTGILISYFVGEQWLLQFAEKIPLTVFLFATSGGFVLAVIILCVVMRAWDVATENPVKSIKTE